MLSSDMSAKAEEIRRVLSEPVVDLWKLRELALTEGGLVNGQLVECHEKRCNSCVINLALRSPTLTQSTVNFYSRPSSISLDTLRKLAWPKLVGVNNDGHDHVTCAPVG